LGKLIIYFAIISFLFSFELRSQDTDSLIHSLPKETNDTVRIKAFIKIVKFYNSKEPIKALPYALSLVKLAEKVNNEKFLSASYNQLGITYYYLGITNQSAELFLKVLKVNEKNNDSLGISRSLNNIGLAYQDDNAFEKSLEYFKQSLDIKLKIKDYPTLWTTYMNIGLSCNSLKEYDKALINYLSGLAAWENLKKDKNEDYASIISDIGVLYQITDSLTKAEKYLNEAVPYFEKSNTTYRVAKTLLNLAIVYRKRGDNTTAQNYLDRSIKLILKSGAYSILPDYYLELSNIEKSKGNIIKAFEYYKKQQTLRDSISIQQNLADMNRVQEMYKIEKHEAETLVLKKEIELGDERLLKSRLVTGGAIILLIFVIFFSVYLLKNISRWRIANNKLKDQQNTIGKANEALQRQRDELQILADELKRLNSDKDRFMTILGHDLKSPFNILLGLSELLTDSIRTTDIGEIEDIATNLNKTARNTYSLLEDILLWTRVQTGKIPFKPKELKFDDLLRNTKEVLVPAANAKSITINSFVRDEINIYADPDMIKTVLRNLVSNAIKFTNKSGTINIGIVMENSDQIISVSDNGIGIKPDNLSRLFKSSEFLTTAGTEHEAGTGLGLLLCKEFVEIHGGRIWVESEFGKGSEFKFALPSVVHHT
jgi:signal transduction histidine kinase